MSVIGLVRAVAQRQHGAVTRTQLFEQGATRQAIQWAVRVGELIAVAPEVFVIAGSPRTWRQALMVAVLDAGPGACVSHRAAAILLGIARRDAPEIVEISVPRKRSGRMTDAVVHRTLDLTPEHVMVVDGIPCSGPLRTLVDLGAVEPWWEVRDAVERAIQLGHTTHRGCEWMLARLSKQGRHGCGVFRRVLDERALKAGTAHKGLLEPRMAGVARRFGLLEYVYQYKVFDDLGTFLAQLDFAWPAFKVAVEVDGLETHGTAEAMTADFERDQMLEIDHGWYVLHFSWWHIVKRPKYVVDRILQVLDARRTALQV